MFVARARVMSAACQRFFRRLLLLRDSRRHVRAPSCCAPEVIQKINYRYLFQNSSAGNFFEELFLKEKVHDIYFGIKQVILSEKIRSFAKFVCKKKLYEGGHILWRVGEQSRMNNYKKLNRQKKTSNDAANQFCPCYLACYYYLSAQINKTSTD